MEEDNIKENNKFKTIIKKYFNNSYQSFINYFGSILAFISFVFYIITTYYNNIYYIFIIFDYFIMSYFFIEYILKYYVSNNKIEFIFDSNSLILLICFVPLIFNYWRNFKWIQIFYNICVIIRFIRFINLINFLLSKNQNEINQQISKIMLTIFTLVIINSSLIQVFENPYRLEIRKNNDIICSIINENDIVIPNSNNICDGFNDTIKYLNFNNAFYFTIVSISTVGYGDITPKSAEGRIQIIIFIFIFILLVPKQTNELINLLNLQSYYKRKKFPKVKEIPHLVLCGNFDLKTLNYFCEELFHPDHGNNDKAAVILQSDDPDNKMKLFLKNPKYDLLLTYLAGDPLNESDLDRIILNKAVACFIFSEKNLKDPLKADHANIITTMSINKYAMETLNTKLRIFIQWNKNESKKYFYSSLNSKECSLIIIENLKMALIAKSCLCPGVISLWGNLIRSFGDQEIELCKSNWMKEYLEGTRHEIYRTKLSNYFEGKKFSELSAIIYKLFNGIIFTLEIEINNKVILITNPGDYEIININKNKIHVFIICEDKQVADQVETFSNFDDIDNKQNIENLNKDIINLNSSNENSSEESIDFDSNYSVNSENSNKIKTELVYLSKDEECTWKNHIIILGVNSSLYYFISFLKKNSQEIPIVILNINYLENDVKEKLNKFKELYFLKGDPLNINNLLFINIINADKAVILQNIENIEIEEKNIDYNVIFLYKVIKSCQKNIQIIVELNNPQNIEILNNIDDKTPKSIQNFSEFQYQFENLYASGEIYLSAFIDTLTCQSFYNPHIITILNKFLLNEKIENPVIEKICEETKLINSKLYQISIPNDFTNKTFGDLYQYLCEFSLIPLGLYRQPYLYDNEFHYTFTNPSKNVKWSYRDKVFVLGHSEKLKLFLKEKDNKTIPNNNDTKNIKRSSRKLDITLDNDKKDYDFTTTFDVAKVLNKKLELLKNNTKDINTIIDYQNKLLLEKLDELTKTIN